MRDLSLHLMDIVQNSIKAQASKIDIILTADAENDKFIIEIEDNGIGMDESLLNQVKNPFATTRTTRKVGLGIPLLEASSARAGGKLEIKSEKGKGTCIKADFQISHIDRLPLGNIGETMMGLVAANPETDFNLNLCNMKENFAFSVLEIKEQLDDVPIDNSDVLIWIRDYISEGIKVIFGGVLNEIDS
ncbi:MAG TPA: ATP-binding protein [Clostridiales bacterium]|nr:ATP-binding protein [Clostridiales bacterium]